MRHMAVRTGGTNAATVVGSGRFPYTPHTPSRISWQLIQNSSVLAFSHSGIEAAPEDDAADKTD